MNATSSGVASSEAKIRSPSFSRSSSSMAAAGRLEAALDPGLGAGGRLHRADRQRDAVHGDGALLDDVAGQPRRQADAHDLPVLAGRAGQHRADAVDVALD